MLVNNVEIRTAADAASLAGASTAVVTPIGLQPEPDGNGGYKFVSSGWQTTINKQQADDVAQKLLALNLPSGCSGGTFQSQVSSNGSRYYVFLSNINMPTLLSTFLGKPVYLGANSDSEAGQPATSQ